jgi:hypothetical protein
VQEAFRRVLRAHQRAVGGPVDGIGLSEIAAGVEPAHRTRKAATLAGGLGHDASILFGVGRQLGRQPGANTSMTIMRAPQPAGTRRDTSRSLARIGLDGRP